MWAAVAVALAAELTVPVRDEQGSGARVVAGLDHGHLHKLRYAASTTTWGRGIPAALNHTVRKLGFLALARCDGACGFSSAWSDSEDEAGHSGARIDLRCHLECGVGLGAGVTEVGTVLADMGEFRLVEAAGDRGVPG